jgi:hypothetical protein
MPPAAVDWTAEAAVPPWSRLGAPRIRKSLTAGQAAGGFAAVHGVDVAGGVGCVVGG